MRASRRCAAPDRVRNTGPVDGDLYAPFAQALPSAFAPLELALFGAWLAPSSQRLLAKFHRKRKQLPLSFPAGPKLSCLRARLCKRPTTPFPATTKTPTT